MKTWNVIDDFKEENAYKLVHTVRNIIWLKHTPHHKWSSSLFTDDKKADDSNESGYVAYGRTYLDVHKAKVVHYGVNWLRFGAFLLVLMTHCDRPRLFSAMNSIEVPFAPSDKYNWNELYLLLFIAEYWIWKI